MSITNEQLAELLSGIARSQQAIIDAIERSDGGWRNTHLIPVLNVAANIRQADPRLIDLPSRILLRLQGRAAVDIGPILADLERLFSLPPGAVVDASAATAPAPGRFATRSPSVATAAAPAAPAAAPAAPRPAAAAPAAVPGAAAAAAPRPVPPAPPPTAPAAPPAAAGDEELDFSKP